MSFEERKCFESYVNLVERCMNLNADPSEDFLNFACGRFKNENFDKNNGDIPPSMFGLCEFQIVLEFIAENKQILDPRLKKVKDFMESKRDSLQFIPKRKKFIKLCGGLPAFTENWNQNDFNLARTIGILYEMQCHTFFSLNIRNIDKKVIFVNLDLPDVYDISQIYDILAACQLDDENLKNITNAVMVVQKYLSEDHNKSPQRLCFEKDLEIIYNEEFNFREFIKSATSSNLRIKEDFVINLGEGVVSFLSYLGGLDRRMCADYLTFIVAHNYYNRWIDPLFDLELNRFMPLLFVEHIDHFMPLQFDDELDDFMPPPFNKELSHFIPIIISSGFAKYFNEKEYQKRKYFRDRYNASFRKFKETFLYDTRKQSEYKENSKVDRILQYVDEHYEPEKIRAEYENLVITSEDFEQNLINIKKHGIPKSLQAFRSSRNDMRKSMLQFLNDAVIHWNKPMVFHFSGQELTKWLNFLSKDENKFFLNNDENKKLKTILDSQAAQHKDLRYDYEADDIILRIEAIRRAYSDYKIWMSENKATVLWQNKILSRINLDCHKLFFVAFIQHWVCCKEPQKDKALLILTNFKEFAKTFECGHP